MRRIVVGIDPGADGAIAAIDAERRVVLGVALLRRWAPDAIGEGDAGAMETALAWGPGGVSWPMVAALEWAGALLPSDVHPSARPIYTLACEAPQLRPGQAGGAVQAWRAGVLAAEAGAVLAARGRLGRVVVEAQTWTREMGLQVRGQDRADRKRARVARVLELAPTAWSMLQPRPCRVPHDGAADAILIAMWAAGLRPGGAT